jgi:hypothetical protein
MNSMHRCLRIRRGVKKLIITRRHRGHRDFYFDVFLLLTAVCYLFTIT